MFASGYNQMFIIPVGATTISIKETVATRNYLGMTDPVVKQLFTLYW